MAQRCWRTKSTVIKSILDANATGLRKHARISDACLDAALKNIDKITIMGTRHLTQDRATVRDFVHVVDLVEAHIAVMEKKKIAQSSVAL